MAEPQEPTEYPVQGVLGVIDITPHWPGILRWQIEAVASHSWDRGYTVPVITLIETALMLERTDPDELQRIIGEYNAKANVKVGA